MHVVRHGKGQAKQANLGGCFSPEQGKDSSATRDTETSGEQDLPGVIQQVGTEAVSASHNIDGGQNGTTTTEALMGNCTWEIYSRHILTHG